jgi:hypothetical protein
MNDPTYVEAARALAARVMNEASTTPARIALAFRLATARTPSASEARTLESLVARQMAHYRDSPQSAAELVSVGESKVGASLNKIELAAWTTLAQVILSLDETISEE